MASTQDGPFFNLKAVVQQTGLKPDTLRAWERRYDLPTPRRSGGGHRLYTQHDIRTIKWLMDRQREGLSIKRAVELWRQIEADGRDPLQTATPLAIPAAPVQAPRPAGDSLVQLRNEWIDGCLAYDERRAEQALNQAFAFYAPEVVVTELMQVGVVEIGNGWYRGEVTVQQEHFCSALAIRRLEALVMAAPPPNRPGRILAACPPQENHIFGLLLLTLLLRRRGWEVVYLGANVPAEQLETTVAVTHPQLVVLAAQQLHSAATLLEMAEELQQEGVPLAYGGLIFNLLPGLRSRIPGHFLGEGIKPAVEAVEALMTAPRPAPASAAIADAYLQAGDHFRVRQGLIEAHVVEELLPAGMASNHLAVANRELGLNIGAALQLGDMGFLGADIEWLEGLMKHHHMPSEMLYGYLEVYRRTAEEQLDERGQPVVDWLDGVLERHRGNGG